MHSHNSVKNLLGFYTIDVKIKEVAGGLGLNDIGLDKPVDALSGGQRSKVLLTKLLLENPMILILDEPTNYLDENHISWLISFLQNYENDQSYKNHHDLKSLEFHQLRPLIYSLSYHHNQPFAHTLITFLVLNHSNI